MLPQLFIPKNDLLPDNDQWQHRFQVRSASSNRLYTIAQHKKNKHWGCSCPGWKAHRTCNHLRAIGIPGHEKPFEVDFKID